MLEDGVHAAVRCLTEHSGINVLSLLISIPLVGPP